jgi:tripartite-type tricarboxylate transporter receptor subunit TctC
MSRRRLKYQDSGRTVSSGNGTAQGKTVQINALKTAEFHERLLGMGTNPVGSTPQEYASHLRTEVAKMRQAIRMSGARLD